MTDLHEVAENIGYRSFHDMVDSNYTRDELIEHIVEYMQKDSKKWLVDVLVEYIWDDKEYDVSDFFFAATGVKLCD